MPRTRHTLFALSSCFLLLLPLLPFTRLTHASGECVKGDVNCDGSVNLSDFEIFRIEFAESQDGTLNPTTARADLNHDTFVNLNDFEIFRKAFVADSTRATITPTATGIPSTQPTATATPTKVPTQKPTSGATPTASSGVQYPAQALNLTNWKETLPIGEPKKPLEIKQPQLATYKLDPWFSVVPGGVRFRAPVNGVTTSGSGYPRSELREMVKNGSENASWSSTTGTHTMKVVESITAVPQTKKHVVAGQIHDGSSDVIVIRLELPKLYVNVDGKNDFVLDDNYSLGKKFSFSFVVSDGNTDVFYNNSSKPVYSLNKSYSGAYFKAGAYTQSNCSTESAGKCIDSNFGEVVIYELSVTH